MMRQGVFYLIVFVIGVLVGVAISHQMYSCDSRKAVFRSNDFYQQHQAPDSQ